MKIRLTIILGILFFSSCKTRIEYSHNIIFNGKESQKKIIVDTLIFNKSRLNFTSLYDSVIVPKMGIKGDENFSLNEEDNNKIVYSDSTTYKDAIVFYLFEGYKEIQKNRSVRFYLKNDSFYFEDSSTKYPKLIFSQKDTSFVGWNIFSESSSSFIYDKDTTLRINNKEINCIRVISYLEAIKPNQYGQGSRKVIFEEIYFNKRKMIPILTKIFSYKPNYSYGNFVKLDTTISYYKLFPL